MTLHMHVYMGAHMCFRIKRPHQYCRPHKTTVKVIPVLIYVIKHYAMGAYGGRRYSFTTGLGTKWR
jgi:hypothetical protein